MVICLFRPPDGDQEGSAGVRRLPQASAGRWFHDDAVLRLCAPLSQRGECGRTHQTGAESVARNGASQYTAGDGQTIRQHAELRGDQKTEAKDGGGTTTYPADIVLRRSRSPYIRENLFYHTNLLSRIAFKRRIVLIPRINPFPITSHVPSIHHFPHTEHQLAGADSRPELSMALFFPHLS